jgi:hypothetical protein
VINRRAFVASLPLAVGAGAGAELVAQVPGVSDGARVPKLEFVYECDVTLGETLPFGPTIEGTRRIIPITGGKIVGPQIRAELVPGGFDWNLSRSDGAAIVEASYYCRTDDGVVIRITNVGVGGGAGARAGGPASADAEPFIMFTTPSFEAPAGKYDWLNRSVFVGTLGARRNARAAVLIRVFRVV